MSDLIFPVLLHQKRDKRFYSYVNEKNLFVADKELVAKGIFKDTFIIDSYGNEYLIRSVKEKGWATPLWGYSIFIKGRQIKIEFEIEFIQQIPFDKFKEFVLTQVESAIYIYESYGSGFEEVVERINAAESYKDIIEIFY